MSEVAGKSVSADTEKGRITVGNEEMMRGENVVIPSPPEGIGNSVFVALNGENFGTVILSDNIKKSDIPTVSSLLTAEVNAPSRQVTQRITSYR